MSLSLELEFPKCPKCERNLKPSIKQEEQDLKYSFLFNGIKHFTHFIGIDYLGCRYCNIRVKTSLLRKQKDIPKFLEQFAKIPEETEISEEEKEKIRLRKNHNKNMEKYKHYPVPHKCVECNSEDLVADSSDNGWVCLSCDFYFEWRSYKVIFHGDIELDGENENDAIDRAYDLLGNDCKVDLEAEIDWITKRW